MAQTFHVSNHVAELAAAVRRRPGMYFGPTDSRAIPRIVRGIIQCVLEEARLTYKGPVEVKIGKEQIAIRFHKLAGKLLNPERFAKSLSEPRPAISWDSISGRGREQMLRRARREEFLWNVLASDRFQIVETKHTSISKISVENGRVRLEKKGGRKRTQPLTEITLRLARKPFGQPGHNEFYEISGDLRDLSLLREGLRIKLNGPSETELSFCYDRGIESLVFEEAHHRWLIYDGVLRAAAEKKGMKFECCICFVHAGVPRIHNWVNFYPTQGGAHLEAIGRALHELLGEGGCRSLPLVTNPDDGKTIFLWSSLVGAIHVQTDEPRFQGPTKDVLIGDDVFDFVYEHCKKQFTAQWQDLRGKRAL